MKWLGLVPLSFYVVHALASWRRGRWYNAFWLCHVAAVAVGIGLLAGSAPLVGTGVLWLLAGVPLWLMDVAAGGAWTWTSVLTHLGSVVAGVVGVRELGMPAGAWWQAAVGVAGLCLTCRLITPPSANVNLAFAVHRGWEKWFPSHRWYLALLAAMLTAGFYVAERLLRTLVNGAS